ncbi:MAG: heavy metal-binding domain-containing protein [Nitrospirae bacterium]|nr:heavy metal-binding domain-containing protein [Nitrospirota bacterium]MBI3351518.1 heavy metal-binding domain-containing protein [Nitrospirota bacterium]
MICQACGNDQKEGAECLKCHTTFVPGSQDQIHQLSTPSALELFERGSSSPLVAPEGSPEDPAKKIPEDDAKNIQEHEKQIQLQLVKMEEEKQRLLELKLNLGKQIQEAKVKEEQKKAQKKETEIDSAVDKIKTILVTSLSAIENKPVLEHKGLVGSQVLIKTDALETAISSLKDAAGLRNTPYYDNLKKGFQIGLTDLKIEASKLQANAVVGVVVHEQYLKDQVLIVSFTGTAILI